MLQDVQKISSKLLLIDIMCVVLFYGTIKTFAGFTNHTYQNITKQIWHKISFILYNKANSEHTIKMLRCSSCLLTTPAVYASTC